MAYAGGCLADRYAFDFYAIPTNPLSSRCGGNQWVTVVTVNKTADHWMVADTFPRCFRVSNGNVFRPQTAFHEGDLA